MIKALNASMMSGRSHLLELESDLVLSQRLMQSLGGLMNETLEVGQDIAQYCQDDQELRKITQDTMLTFINLEEGIKQYTAALKHVKENCPRDGAGTSSETESVDSCPDLTATYTHKLAELHSNASRDQDRLVRHEKYQELETTLSSTGTVEEQLNTLRAALVGSADDSQGDLAMTDVEINTRCPYTGCLMVDPVRNTRCGHVYEKGGILDYIRQKRAKAKCPVGGCSNTDPVQASDLEEHRNMKRYITLLSQQSQIS